MDDGDTVRRGDAGSLLTHHRHRLRYNKQHHQSLHGSTLPSVCLIPATCSRGVPDWQRLHFHTCFRGHHMPRSELFSRTMHWFGGCKLQPLGQLPVLYIKFSWDTVTLPHHDSRVEQMQQWLQDPGAESTSSPSGPSRESSPTPERVSASHSATPNFEAGKRNLLLSQKTELELLGGQHWCLSQWLTPGHRQGGISEMAASFLQEQAWIWMGTNTAELISLEHYFTEWHPCSGNMTGFLYRKFQSLCLTLKTFKNLVHTHTHTHIHTLSHSVMSGSLQPHGP